MRQRVGLVVPFAFIAAYIVAVGAITFINIRVFGIVDPKFSQAWLNAWLELYWPFWTVGFTPSAISALVACWLSRPLTWRDATTTLGVYLFLILVVIEAGWVLDPYITKVLGNQGFWFLIGAFAVLSTIFFAMAFMKRAAVHQGDKSTLHE
jgi:hypothetical protein